jgi:hypothetical protein
MTAANRDTVRKLFDHGHDVEWREVRSLLDAVGTVQERHNGKLEVTVGGETEVLQPPRGKDVDDQLLVDVRWLLRCAGIEAA